jgi:hypothetical protein
MTNYNKIEMMIDGNWVCDKFDTNGQQSIYISQGLHCIGIHEMKEENKINVVWEFEGEVIRDKVYVRAVKVFDFINKVLCDEMNYLLN